MALGRITKTVGIPADAAAIIESAVAQSGKSFNAYAVDAMVAQAERDLRKARVAAKAPAEPLGEQEYPPADADIGDPPDLDAIAAAHEPPPPREDDDPFALLQKRA